jgi:ABC-type transport system involved in multi-copper enzyme maturation permease subunit
MLGILVRKEILNNLLNLRFILAYFLCTFLLAGSASIMFADFLAQKKVEDVNKAVYDERIGNIDHFIGLIFSDKIIVRRPILTRMFAIGVEKDPDPRASVAGASYPYFYGDYKRNPLGNLFPSVDMLFVVGVILSLLIFVLTYDMVSGEREEGTLKVVLSCPVPRDQILAAKWLGGFSSLVIPFITSALIILLMLVFNRQITVGAQEWLRILSIFAVGVLYIAVVFSLSIMVSVFFTTSSTSILTLLLTWVIVIVALPALSTPVVTLIMAPEGVHGSEIRMQRKGVLGLEQVKVDFRNAVNSRFGGRKPHEMRPDEFQILDSIIMTGQVRVLSNGFDSIIDEGRRAFRQWEQVETAAQWIRRLSPFGCLQNASIGIAGTGLQREKDLRKSVEDYGRACMAYVQDYVPRFRKETFSAANAPKYTLTQTSSGHALASVFPDILALLLMGVLFVMIAFVRFLKTEIM